MLKFLFYLFAISIVTSTTPTDVPPTPPVAGLAVNQLPAAPKLSSDKPAKRTPKPRKSNAPRKSSPAPRASDKSDAKSNTSNSGAKAKAKPAALVVPQKIPTQPVYKFPFAKLKALAINTIRAGTPVIVPRNPLNNKNYRFGTIANRHLEVDLTKRPGVKKVGSIYHNLAKAVPSRFCSLPKKPYAPKQKAVCLAMLPADGTDILGGASGAQMVSEDRVARLERQIEKVSTLNESNILRVVAEEKMQDHLVALEELRGSLLPERCQNKGTPDTLNGRPAIRPTIATRYKVPFTSGKAAIMVQDHPAEHVVVLGSSDGTYAMCTLTNSVNTGASSLWDWQGQSDQGFDVGQEDTPSYLVDGQTSTFKVAEIPVINLTTLYALDPQTATIATKAKPISYIPIDSGSQCVTVANVGSDTTTDGFIMSIVFVLLTAGIYTLQTVSATLTGVGGSITKTNWATPATAVGIYELAIANNDAGTVTTTSRPQIQFTIQTTPGDVVIPMGKSDGSDLAFFQASAPELRVDHMSARGIFWAGFQENDEVTFGQFDETEDGDIPPPSFDSWAALTRFRTKPMNDPANNGCYVPMMRRDFEGFDFQSVAEGELDKYNSSERLGFYLESTGSEAEHVILETMLDLTACGLAQGLGAKSGIVNLNALALAQDYRRKFVLATGNDAHEVDMESLLLGFMKEFQTGTNVNVDVSGWLSGNVVSGNNVV